MKRVHSLVLLFVLVIAPMFPMFMVPTTNEVSSVLLDDFPVELMDVNGPDSFLEEDVELNMMFFTETPSSENGLYYVCRRGTDSIAYFGESMVKYVSDGVIFTLEFPGSNEVIPHGEKPTGSVTNYMYGNEPSHWKTGIADCAVLLYPEIYDGIDLRYKIDQGNLKYEFVVHPNSNPKLIHMRYPDADLIETCVDSISISKEESLLSDKGLFAYLDTSHTVDVSFEILDATTICFNVAEYDEFQTLVIDPILVYSTFIGGTGNDHCLGIDVENGFAYITGYTGSVNFPVFNANDSTLNGDVDCFVMKLANDGQSLIYSSYLGGESNEFAFDIDVEDEFAYITGYTQSSDFPTTSAYDSTQNGAADAFITKFAVDGQSLVYSTYIGDSDNDISRSIAVDDGFAFITGITRSFFYPLQSPYDSSYNGGGDCFVTKFNTTGNGLNYSTFLGGGALDDGMDIDIECGFAYITGYTTSSDFPTQSAYDSTQNGDKDAFVAKLSTDGQFLNYSTFIGGSDSDEGLGIAVKNGYAYVTGVTESDTFPLYLAYDQSFNEDYDCFITKLNTTGATLGFSTFLGGAGREEACSIYLENGHLYIAGYTSSSDFPTIKAFDESYNGNRDGFIALFTTDGQTLEYSSYIGGSGNDEVQDIVVENKTIYLAGYTYSIGFPTIDAYNSTLAGEMDCFVSVLSEDSDMDGLFDWHEAFHGTNSYCIDTDNDNFLDAYEVSYGSDPLDPMSYPVMPQAWYDAIYGNLDGNSTLIQNLITWVDGNSSLLQTMIQQLDDNATLLTQVIAWLDGNHTAIETLFTQLDGNATLLMTTVNALNGNSSLIQNLLTWSAGNETLLLSVIQQAADNSALLAQVITWLDGNHTAIETLFTHLDGNATLLMTTVNALNGNSSLIQNLLTWSAGNETLLLNVIDQVDAIVPTDLTQVIAWLDGNHTAIETLFTYVEGNATLLLNTVAEVNANEAQLDILAALISGNTAYLNSLNASHFDDFDDLQDAIDEIRDIVDELGISVGDSDYDGLDDLDELSYGTDLLCIDSDTDNLNDAFEVKIGTDPLDDDSDADSYLDGVEVIAGSDPLDPLSYPGSGDSTLFTTIILIVGCGAVVVVIVIVFFMKKKRM